MHIQINSETRYNIIRELLGRLRVNSEEDRSSRPYSGFKQIALQLVENATNDQEKEKAEKDIAYLERLENLPPYPLKLTRENVQDITRIYQIMGDALMSRQVWQYFMEYCDEKGLLPAIQPLPPAQKEGLANVINSVMLKVAVIQANGTATDGTVLKQELGRKAG